MVIISTSNTDLFCQIKGCNNYANDYSKH